MGQHQKEFVFTGKERRQNTRYPFWAMVSLNEIRLEDFSFTSGYTNDTFASAVNLSQEGMLLETFEKFRTGAVLSLSLSTNQKETSPVYNFTAKVVHSYRHKRMNIQNTGIKFLKKPNNFSELFKPSLNKQQ